MTSSAVGTPHYMAPEQVEDAAQVGPAADIWAFGVVAYECLTGRRPFDDESIGKLMIRVLAATPPTPASSFAPVPTRFDEWFRIACARAPGARFPDMQTAASELLLALDTTVLGPAPSASRAGPEPPATAREAAPTLVSLRAVEPAAAPEADDPLPMAPALPANMSPLAETLAPPPSPGAAESSPAELPARASPLASQPAPLHVSRLLRALPALGALTAAVLAILLAGRDAPGRARAPVAFVHAPEVAPAALPPSDALLVQPTPVLIEPVAATSCTAPVATAPPSVAPPHSRSRRRPSQATPSVYRLPPLGL
jgi:serine/threonine protein kinase